MREGWKRTKLAEVAEIVMGQAPSGTSYNTSGEGLPFIQGSREFGVKYPKPEKWCSAPRKIAEEGDLLMSVRAPVGDINWADRQIAIGRGLSIIRAGGGTSQEFLKLVLEHATDELATASSSGMFASITKQGLAGIQVNLPPLHEQQRTVDLIGSLDGAIEAAARAAIESKSVVDEIAGVLSSSMTASLGSLAKMRSGPSWGAADESSQPLPGYYPVLAITNTRPSGDVDLTEQRYVQGLADNVMRLTSSSLVMIRTNGNRSRIGNIYRSSEQILGFAVSAFQIAIEPLDRDDSDFLYWMLAEPSRQALISNSASGSTGLGNVAIGWLKQLEIPYPEDEAVRRDFVALCEAANKVHSESRSLVSSLRAVRSELLAVLLSGEHEIPESYDVDTAVQLEPAA